MFIRIRSKRLHCRFKGWSLIELVVTIAAMGLVAMIALPAIQMVRESSRRTACASNMRQIGLSIIDFESIQKRYPDQGWHRDVAARLEYEQVFLVDPGPPPWEPLAILACPSDRNQHARSDSLYTSYLGCSGSRFWRAGFDGVIVLDIYGLSSVSSSDVHDGLTNTALLSESLVDGPGRLEVAWEPPGPAYAEAEWEKLVELAEQLPSDPEAAGFRPMRSLKGQAITPSRDGEAMTAQLGMLVSAYCHGAAPNRPSLTNSGGGIVSALATASSNHPVGVNVQFADGRVDFISRDVSLSVWRAAATRSGAETGNHLGDRP